jgi:hypothetical protein
VKNNHFDEAYVKHLGGCIDIFELLQIRKNNELLFNSEFRENMLCPECLKAFLVLEYGPKIKCLRTWKGEHDEDCQHSPGINIATKKQIKAYGNYVNPQTKENNLLSLLYRLNNPKVDIPSKTKIPFQKPDFLYKITTGKTTTRVVILQQKIRSDRKNKFSNDIAKYYYGIVWIEIGEKSREYNEVLLRLYSLSKKEKGDFICGLKISKNGNLSSLTDELLKKQAEGPYAIAFFGQMELIEININYSLNNLYINDKHDIKLEVITSQEEIVRLYL